MSKIELPRNFSGASRADDAFVVQSIDVAIPEGLPQPQMYRLFMIPVGARTKTKGGIFLPDDVLDAQNWAHQLYKVAAVGAYVFKSPRYQEMGVTEADQPKVGDLYLISPKQPQRFGFAGLPIVVVNDDQLWGKVDPESTSSFKFYGYEL